MEYITMIMSGLALLAATVSLILTVCEKKRNQKRNADMANYVEYECRAVKDDLCFHAEKFSARLEGLAQGVRQKSTELDNLSTKVENLEKGIVPDYEEALAAKNSVDDFNRGLSAIMGFDPMEAVKKSREQRKYGGEVK
jgi:uncharacterized protein YoxC